MIGVVGLAMAMPVHAQEAEENPPPQRPPVFDLQPGPVREQPQPDVQGPRAPGLPSPRLIEDSDDQPVAPPVAGTSQSDATTEPASEEPAPATQAATAEDRSDRPAAPTESDTATATTEPDTNTPSSETVAERRAAGAPARPGDPEPALPDQPAPTDSDGLPWWIWLGLALAIGIAVLVVRMAARRVPREDNSTVEPMRATPQPRDEPASPPIEPEPEPQPATAPVSVQPKRPQRTQEPIEPPAAPDAEDRPSRIIVDFQPMAARLSTVGLTVSYGLYIENVSDEVLTDIVVRLGIRCADGGPGQSAPNPEPPCVTIDTLQPGGRHKHNGAIRLDPQTYRPVQSGGKPMIVPIVDMLPAYRDGDGHLHEMHAEMLVGRELKPSRPKMQPFWLEQGFGQFNMIGCRMLSVKRA